MLAGGNSEKIKRGIAAVRSIRAAAIKAHRAPPNTCRICFEESGDFISPCHCRGTQQYVHKHCVWRWRLRFPPNDERYILCGVCKGVYTTNEVPAEIRRPVLIRLRDDDRCVVERRIAFALLLMVNLGVLFWTCAEFHVLVRPNYMRHHSHPLKYGLLGLHCVNHITVSILPTFDRSPPGCKQMMSFGGVGLMGLVGGATALIVGVPVIMYSLTAVSAMVVIPYLLAALPRRRRLAVLPL